MTERELPQGRGNGVPNQETWTPQKLKEQEGQARFNDLATQFRRGELTRYNEDGTETNIVTFESYIDPLNRTDMTVLTEFRHRAAAVGLREAFSPLVLPTVAGATPETAHRPLTFVQLGYEAAPKPSTGS